MAIVLAIHTSAQPSPPHTYLHTHTIMYGYMNTLRAIDGRGSSADGSDPPVDGWYVREHGSICVSIKAGYHRNKAKMQTIINHINPQTKIAGGN